MEHYTHGDLIVRGIVWGIGLFVIDVASFFVFGWSWKSWQCLSLVVVWGLISPALVDFLGNGWGKSIAHR